MGTRAANVLRAVVAGTREAGDKRQIRARLQRAWDGLSTAEKIALGGTLAAAIMGGGGLMLRAGLNAMTRPLSIAEMRAMTTKSLLRSFERGNESQNAAIAKFCVCRVHDVRDFLLDDELAIIARQILTRISQLLDSESKHAGSWSRTAQVSFIKTALDLNIQEARAHDPGAREKAEAIVDSKLQTTRENTFRSDGSEEAKRRYEDLYKKELQRLMWKKEKIQGSLHEAIKNVDKYGDYQSRAEYGPFATWDVREVADMSKAFMARPFTSLDLSFWDTREVRNMRSAFAQFKGEVDVKMWDTRNVRGMSEMFYGARKFNSDIGSWDTSEVTDADRMFNGAANFNQDLSRWSLGHVKDPVNMFTGSGIGDENKKPAKVRSGSAGEVVALFGQAALRAYV